MSLRYIVEVGSIIIAPAVPVWCNANSSVNKLEPEVIRPVQLNIPFNEHLTRILTTERRDNSLLDALSFCIGERCEKWTRAVANEMIENIRNNEDGSIDLDNSYTTNIVNLIYDQ